MSLKNVSRVLAVTCLTAGFDWSFGIAADKPADNANSCPNSPKTQAASKSPTENGCCGKCQTEKAPVPKLVAEPQKGSPAGKGPGGKDATFAADRDTFHFLLENHKDIKRTVKKLDNGVESVTESEKPEVTKKIQEHVPAMYERLKSGKVVRYWDPLFAEAFKHGKKMKMEIKNTDKGVKVIETSEDAEVVKIIQAHADVVTKFVERGFDEAHKEHPLPTAEKKK